MATVLKETELQLPPTDHTPRPYTGPSREEVLAMRRQYVNPAVFTIYREPSPTEYARVLVVSGDDELSPLAFPDFSVISTARVYIANLLGILLRLR